MFRTMKKTGFVIVLLISIIIILPAVSGSVSQQGERTPIKHVINIYFENHTFDNFFGTYPDNPSSANQTLISQIAKPVNLLNNTSLLSSLTSVAVGTFNTSNPIEGYSAYHIDWNHGKMNGFLQGSGPSSMTYYTAAQLGPMWDLSEEYGMSDMYFAPVISESAPNTLYYLAGFSPVFNDYGPPPSIPISETIFGELNNYGIPWGVYVGGNEKSFDMSSYIQGINAYSNDIHSWSTLLQQLSNGTLPAVSYVFSQDANGYDMGAPGSLLKGEVWLISLINYIESSPVWNSTAIFITWDDPGGYYDQVAPPIVDGVQFGMRLPLIVVSPFSKENYISDTILSHSSILAFIDYNWNLPALNGFVSSVNLPLDFFDFNQTRAPMTFTFGNITLPTHGLEVNITQALFAFNLSGTFPVAPQEPFKSLHYSEHGEINYTLSSIGAGVLIKNDVTYSPFYSSPYLLLILVIAAVLIVEFLPGRRK
jgi:phospholipase C